MVFPLPAPIVDPAYQYKAKLYGLLTKPHSAATGKPMGRPAQRNRRSSAGAAARRWSSCTVGCAGRRFGRYRHHEQRHVPPIVLDVDALGLVGWVGARPVLRAAVQNACRARRKVRHRLCASPYRQGPEVFSAAKIRLLNTLSGLTVSLPSQQQQGNLGRRLTQRLD